MNQTCCAKKPQDRGRRTEDIAVPRNPGLEIRKEKVLKVRQQLGEGRYSVAERLDTVVEKIIKDLGEV
jgi:hypothetical protein